MTALKTVTGSLRWINLKVSIEACIAFYPANLRIGLTNENLKKKQASFSLAMPNFIDNVTCHQNVKPADQLYYI